MEIASIYTDVCAPARSSVCRCGREREARSCVRRQPATGGADFGCIAPLTHPSVAGFRGKFGSKIFAVENFA